MILFLERNYFPFRKDLSFFLLKDRIIERGRETNNE